MQVIGSRRLSTELGDLVEKVNPDGKFGFEFNYATTRTAIRTTSTAAATTPCTRGTGFRSCSSAPGSHRDYHQVTDEVEYLDFDKFANVVRFVADLAGRVADLDHRPVVDKPKPDPEAPCQQ